MTRSLPAAIAASRAIAAGARVFVLYLTTGVPPERALWPWQRPAIAERVWRRQEEALGVVAAARVRDRRLSRHGRAAPAIRPRCRCLPTSPRRSPAARRRRFGCRRSKARIRTTMPRTRWRRRSRARCRSGNSRPIISPAAGSGPMALPSDRGGEIAISGTAAETEAKRAALACLCLGAPQSPAYRG